LEKAVELLKTPKKFVYHVGKDLFYNGVSIYGNIVNGIEDYKLKNYF